MEEKLKCFINNTTQYEFVLPPFDGLPESFNKKTTQQYFEWYLEVLPSRVNCLAELCSSMSGIPIDKIDNSPSSLVYVWEWFLKVAQIEKTSDEILKEIERGLKQFPESFIKHFLSHSERRFTLVTELLLRDIGMYLGNVFANYSDLLNWGYFSRPKNVMYVNTPLIEGFFDSEFTPPFKLNFEPIHMAHVQASKIFGNTATKNDLFNLFKVWENYIPKK